MPSPKYKSLLAPRPGPSTPKRDPPSARPDYNSTACSSSSLKRRSSTQITKPITGPIPSELTAIMATAVKPQPTLPSRSRRQQPASLS